ncbi:MAG TPA: cyclic nucleotide-binding domain-containing protein [Rhodospirillales bacterium]|jgi:CRP-like cAMP-binding protein
MAESILQRQTVQPGETIFKEGEDGNLAYVVQSGQVEIFRNVDGTDVVLGQVGQGGIFGEMALIDSKPRMASARAARGSTVIVVTREMFEQKLKKSDPFVRGLLNILADQIRAQSKSK